MSQPLRRTWGVLPDGFMCSSLRPELRRPLWTQLRRSRLRIGLHLVQCLCVGIDGIELFGSGFAADRCSGTAAGSSSGELSRLQEFREVSR